MRRVLIFTMYYWPESTGIAPMATDLAEYLTKQGWQVSVITGFPAYPKWKVDKAYRGRLFQHERQGDVDIYRVWVYVPSLPKIGVMKAWKRIAFDTTLATSGFPRALTLQRQDVIVSICPPLQTGLASMALKKLWRAPILYWLQDIVPDVAVDVGMMQDGIVLKTGRKLEQTVYKSVDKIGIISHGFQKNLEAKGVPSDKMVFLPNWADIARFDNGPDGKKARRQHGFTDDDFVMVHAGNIGAKQYLENVIQAMKLLEESTNIHLLFVGEGSNLETVKAEAERLDVQRVRFLPTTTGEAYVDLLRAADLLIVNQAKYVKDALVPSKLLTYLPSNRPVIGAVHPESEAAHFIERAGCGVLVEPEAPDKLAEAVLKLSRSPDLRTQMATNGEQFIRQNYERSLLLNKFEETLVEMIETKRS